MSKRSEILQKFLQIAENADKCCEFPLKQWLEKYERCTDEQINFSEAAFLVVSSGKIYGRKVDYLDQMIHEYNRQSAASVREATRDIGKGANGSDDNQDDARKVNEDKEKEKTQRRQKRLLKLNAKIEFKPKQFTIANQSQISLNIHEQRDDLEEDEFEQLRLKNVFPRINILQSNLQNNNSFYDNLGIVEKNCDNLDSLRDYRIFMDTIDEPLKLSIRDASEPDKCQSADGTRSNQKHFNAYVPAEHIKEAYGVEMLDNSDYLNMLKYGEEIERLNLRQLTVEQLGKLKVGTYLNNILHGNKQDCDIPEHDSGMGDSLCDSINESTGTSNNTTAANETGEFNDPGCSEAPDAGPTDADGEAKAAETGEAAEAQAAAASGEDSDVAKPETVELRSSLDDGLGASLIHSPVQMNELDAYERNMLNPVVEVRDIFYPMNKYVDMPDNLTIDLNGPLRDMLTLRDDKTFVPSMDYNIFQIPEQLLRRPKIFKLTEDFDLWLASRKRKARDPVEVAGKLMKLSELQMSRVNAEGDGDENLLGFDENMQPILVKRLPMPISAETSLNLSSCTDPNSSQAINISEHDSGFVSEFNETGNESGHETSMEQSLRLGDGISGNSTQINETQTSIEDETGADSALDTTADTTADLSASLDDDEADPTANITSGKLRNNLL